MSWEVWGTPPDPEPQYCPVCHEESHDDDCELGKMQARALKAERLAGMLSAALMCATDHLDFDALERSHCNSMATIRRGLAAYAEATGNAVAARRAGASLPPVQGSQP